MLNNIYNALPFFPLVFALFFNVSLFRSDNCVSETTFLVSGVVEGMNLSNGTFVPVIVKLNYSSPTVVTAEALRDRGSEGVATLVSPLVAYNTGLPVCTIFITVFFPGGTTLIAASLCLLKVMMTVLITLILGEASFGGSVRPFVLRLPRCGLPALDTLLGGA